MDLETLTHYLDHPQAAAEWLRAGRPRWARGGRNLASIARSGITLDLLAVLGGQLAEHLQGLSDPDMALNNLDRFFGAARNPLALARCSNAMRSHCRRCCRSSRPAST